MPTQRLLLVNADAAIAYRHRNGHPIEEAVFEASNAGLTAFVSYLAQHQNKVFHLLADLAEEGFHAATIPKVGGRDRRAVLERKLGQYFFGTPYTAAISQGRENEARRDEKVLLAGLSRPELIDPWLTACAQAKTRVAGIQSPPLLLARLIKPLQLNRGRHLLLTVGRSGFRQTFFADGHLLFSRLTPLPAGAEEDAARICADEVPRLLQHLQGQGLLPPNETVQATALVATPDHARWRRHCTGSAILHYQFVDLAQPALRMGFKSPAAESCEALLLNLLARRSPAEQFAPWEALRLHRLAHARTALRTAGMGLLGLALAYSTFLANAAYILEQETEKQAQDNRRNASRIAAAVPPLPSRHGELQALVQRFRLLQAQTSSPLPAMQHLSQALTATSDIELDRFEWRKDAGGIAAEIEAHLPAEISSQPRATAAILAKFTERLQQRPAWTATLLRTPYDEESAKAVKGGGDDSDLPPQAGAFALRLTWNPHHDRDPRP